MYVTIFNDLNTDVDEYLSQVFPLPDILAWEVCHLCLVSRSLGFEPPEELTVDKNGLNTYNPTSSRQTE